jgi:hypothetical protein
MIGEFTKFDAVYSLVGGDLSQPLDGIIRYHSGQTPPSDDAIDAELIRLEKEYSDNEYARNRAKAYDSVGNQLDMLMKDMRDGTTTHQESCEAVKAKFPKP